MPEQLNLKISSTGYRLFFILQLLMQGKISKEEILDKINNNSSILNVGLDTIRLDINTLKVAGFQIKTGDKKEGYKYFLDWNPIKINLTPAEIRALSQVKKAVIDVCEWEFIINLYEVFAKIAKFIENEKATNEFLNFGYFLNVDFRILKQLDICCKNKNLIKILYYSPKNGEKVIDIICKKIVYKRDTKKLHLWGNSSQYKGLTYLRVDNILKIINIDFTKNKIIEDFKTCKYRLRHSVGKSFKLEDNEKITQNNPDFMEIESIVDSQFYFIQRILSFGKHCFWVEDEEIKVEILEKLKKMRSKYE